MNYDNETLIYSAVFPNKLNEQQSGKKNQRRAVPQEDTFKKWTHETGRKNGGRDQMVCKGEQQTTDPVTKGMEVTWAAVACVTTEVQIDKGVERQILQEVFL